MKRRNLRRRILTVFLALTMVVTGVDATAFVSRAVTNAYEATCGTHGATYDSGTGKVTFYVNESDAFYAQVDHMWYQEYASYEEAAQNHISAGGNFIAGVGATAVTAKADGTKTAEVDVADGTGAILYYFNAGAGHARPDYEHIIVIDNGTEGGSTEEGGVVSGDDDTEAVAGAIEFDKVSTEFYRSQDDGSWAGDVNATISYDGTKAVVSADSFGWNAWGIQWKLKGLTSEAENNVYAFDVVSSINKSINVKNETSGVMETITLKAGEKYHYETAVIGTTVDITFDLIGGEGAGTLTFTDMTFAEGTITEAGGSVEEGGSETGGSTEAGDEAVANAIVFDKIKTEFYRSQNDGGWAGDSNATVSYDGTKAVVSADSFGWNAWGVQWKLLDLVSEEETNVFAFDVVSSINKSINVKDENSGNMETITLKAGEKYHYETTITGTTANITFDLVGGEGAGTLTFTNMVFGNGSGVKDNGLQFETLNTEFYRSQDDGGWAGDANAAISYDGTKAVVSADSFGWNAWGIQWKLKGLTSEAENNVYAFDVVSSINKSINVKNETSGMMETINLTAGESYHYETAVTGTTVDITFDLIGGEGAGTLTFTNMTFGPAEGSAESGGEGEEEGALAANSEPLNFEELNISTYRSQDDGGWAGDSNVAFTYSGTTALITADNFGWNAWGIQWALKDLTSSVEDNVFEFDVVSSIDKSIVYKNENTAETKTLTLKAGETYHFAAAVTGKTFNVTFDLTGGAAAGSLTFTNMKFGPVGIVEVAPALTLDRAVDKANGFKVGEDVVINFTATATAWADKVNGVKVNNQAIAAEKYTVGEGTVTLDPSVFKNQGVYTVEVEAEGFNATAVKFPVYAADVAGESWNVAWEDQFNGTELDTTKWSYEIGIQSGEDGASASPVYWGNNERQYYIKESVEVKDGYLVITGDKLTQEVKDQYNVTDTTVQYTSGRIRTATDSGEVLAATTYGRIEAKMILPAGDGYWPAFWMLPTEETINLYGTWASSGELDIMEAVGQNPGQVNGTIHYGGNWPNNIYTGGTYVFPEGGSIADEHVYAVEWEPGELRWYVDDVLYHVENNWYGMDANGEKYSYPAPFDEDFYILFNLAMSGDYVSNVMPTEMGKQMKVDYVRILVDENTDYNASVTTPTTDRDVAFFEANGGYTDLIQDKDYTTLASHAFGDGANVIPGIGYWSSAVNTGAGANATVEVVDGVAKVDVTKQGANDYNIQLIQNIPLAKGYTYRITFDAWTDVTGGRQMIVAPKGDADNAWKAYDSGITAALTTAKKTFTYEFTMTTDSDPTARLEMNLGGALGSVYVDNVSVIALTDAEIESGKEASAKEPLASGEHIYNGAFDKGDGKLGDWTAEGTVGSAADRTYTVTVGAEGAKLTQTGLQLLSEDTYKLTFNAKTAGAGKLRAILKDETGAVTYVSDEFALTAEMAEYGVEFVVPAEQGTTMGTLEFEFLGEGETITLDNVSMKRLTNVHMEWDAYEFYPIGENSLEGFTTYDEVWTWAVNPVNATDIGNGEMALVVKTTPASETWKVMLQKENAALSKGMTYRIRYAVKASAEDQKVEVKIEDTSYNPCYNETLTVGTDWTYVDTTFVSTLAGAGALKFCLAGVNQECNIYVKDVNIVLDGIPVPQFAEGAEIAEMELNSTAALDIVHSPKVQEKYQSFTYESSDADVVEVSADGTVTAKSLGTATITVTSVLGTEFSFDVTVVESVDPDTGDKDDPDTGDKDDPDTGDKDDPDTGDKDDPDEGGNTGDGDDGNKPGQDDKPDYDNKPGLKPWQPCNPWKLLQQVKKLLQWIFSWR